MKRIASVLVIGFLLFAAPLSAAPPRREGDSTWLEKLTKIVQRIIRPLDDPAWPGPPKP